MFDVPCEYKFTYQIKLGAQLADFEKEKPSGIHRSFN